MVFVEDVGTRNTWKYIYKRMLTTWNRRFMLNVSRRERNEMSGEERAPYPPRNQQTNKGKSLTRLLRGVNVPCARGGSSRRVHRGGVP